MRNLPGVSRAVGDRPRDDSDLPRMSGVEGVDFVTITIEIPFPTGNGVWRMEAPFLFWESNGLVHLTGLHTVNMQRVTKCGTWCTVVLPEESHRGPVTCLEFLV